MRLLNYLSCVLIIVALYGARVTIAILTAEDTANATPGTDGFLASPTRENIESTPRPTSTVYKAANCLTNSLNSDSIYCRGSRAIRNVIKNLNRRDKPLVLMRGLEIVPIEPVSNGLPAEPALESDDTFLGYISEYLRSHELNIKFADLLADESERYLSYDVAKRSRRWCSRSAQERQRTRDDLGHGDDVWQDDGSHEPGRHWSNGNEGARGGDDCSNVGRSCGNEVSNAWWS
uniref:Uncharacterized protein n=1 Tax=Bactrocera dorsalis TaxID=27457 RepID=A0A034WU98_BACDO